MTDTERLFRVAGWFACWERDFGTTPPVEAIVAAWSVHRATAYRWLAAWRHANA